MLFKLGGNSQILPNSSHIIDSKPEAAKLTNVPEVGLHTFLDLADPLSLAYDNAASRK